MAEEVKKEMINISKEEWNKVQEQLKMLSEVADKGRVFNYEASHSKKQSLLVKLSEYQDKFIIGWQVIKDLAVFHPTTGRQVGEEQQIEVKLLDKDGVESTLTFNNYTAFSNARYDKRVECEVVSKAEDYEGKISYEVKLPDGRVIKLSGQFLN